VKHFWSLMTCKKYESLSMCSVCQLCLSTSALLWPAPCQLSVPSCVWQ